MVKLASEGACTGCGACMNVCPVGAIRMKYSKKGFLIPEITAACVGCNKCKDTCPVLTKVENKGSKTPDFYAYCASDEIREKSSSGGMFTVLAEHILSVGGYVCGACFDENMKLRHVVTRDRNIINSMRGSKYLQSEIGEVYREIKIILDGNTKVLFVGTPCQVAGLKAMLKSSYEGLLVTIDLLCHGTPSQKFFDSYIKEVSDGKKVVEVSFRNKRFGWSWTRIITFFEDGTEYVGGKDDPYKNAFSRGLMTRYSCYNCIFATYPRQGDITIGDLWKSDELDPASNDKKGTSFVFVNTENGRGIFEQIVTDAKYVNKIEVDDENYDTIPNRVTSKSWMNPNRRRFLELVKRFPFSKAVWYSLKDHYDIGMPVVFFTNNIGSVLTYFALFHVLCDMGYDVRTFERPLDIDTPDYVESKNFIKKWLPEYAYPVQYRNIMAMNVLNEKCDMFVVGSDQVFLETMHQKSGNMFFLQYVNGNRKKIAYSTSFGGPGARGSSAYNDTMKYYLDKFSRISFREDDGVKFANESLKCEQKAQWVLDPVFLCNPKYFNQIVESSNEKDKSDYIGAYILKPHQRNEKFLKKVLKHYDTMPCECICGPEVTKKFWNGELAKCKVSGVFPIENALSLIRNSKFFVTDSFHGVCFCIIFKVDFLVIPRDFVDRFDSLLGRLGLKNRIIKNDLSNLNEDKYKPIDWNVVYGRLELLKSESINYLKNALEEDKELKLNDYDVMMTQLADCKREIEILKEKMKDIDSIGKIQSDILELTLRINYILEQVQK